MKIESLFRLVMSIVISATVGLAALAAVNGCGLKFNLQTESVVRAAFYESITWQIIGDSRSRAERIKEHSAEMITLIENGQLATLALVQAAVEERILEIDIPPAQMLTYQRLVGAVTSDVVSAEGPEIQKIHEIILPRLKYVNGAAIQIEPLL
jgi:hypothetical protein